MGVGAMRAAVEGWTDQWALVRVSGRSMQPTLFAGDRLLVRHGATPREGDLAVVRLPDGVVAVKRVTGRRDGGWWVERDNPAEGVDSWLVGAISDEHLVAVVRARVWPVVRRRRSG